MLIGKYPNELVLCEASKFIDKETMYYIKDPFNMNLHIVYLINNLLSVFRICCGLKRYIE